MDDSIITAAEIKVGSQLAEADGFLWDVDEIVKDDAEDYHREALLGLFFFPRALARAAGRYQDVSQDHETVGNNLNFHTAHVMRDAGRKEKNP